MAPEEFINGYIECALWLSTDNQDSPLDCNYNRWDIAECTLEKMRADCESFFRSNWYLIQDDDVNQTKFARYERAGHDFWLTRNGHGAGFWDGDWPQHGDTLTAACKEYREVYLYVGDDGKIYQD